MAFVVNAPPFICINSLHSLNIDWGFILTMFITDILPSVAAFYSGAFGKHKSYFYIFSIMVEFYGIKTFQLQKGWN